MLLLYYTHSILFYLGLPTFQTNNDFKKNLHSFDYEYLPQEVCVAKCLARSKVYSTTEIKHYQDRIEKENNGSLKFCLDTCASVNVTNLPPPKQIHENYSFHLICRDDNSLNFNIDLHKINRSSKLNTNETTEIEMDAMSFSTDIGNTEMALNKHEHETLFVIKVHLANNAEKIFVYLSDENFFTVNQLMANTTYNISVLAVHSNNKYSVIAQQQQFKTLRRSYTPASVREIKINHFDEDKLNKMHLTASLTWKPAADMTCYYDIICFSPEREDYDLQPLEIRNPRQLFKYQLENLTFSSVYKVGIRASNAKGMRESELFWKTFTAPSCVEWHNYNFNICAPEAPQNLQVEQIIVDQQLYSLNISWQLPKHLPDNYTLRIQDLSEKGKTTNYQLAKDIHNFFIPQIHFHGVFYEVSLTAYTVGGHTTTTYTDITKTIVRIPEKNPVVKLIAVILAPIFCVAILSLTIFIIYHRRAKLKRYQARCKYFEELEKKAPIDSKNHFNFTTNLTTNPNDFSYQIESPEHLLHDDDMEIDSNNLILYQVLGEGAFGLVKLGLYKDTKLGITQQVAVKMLKDHPSAEDIYAFRREIEVMKSVEKHPNIVGIIGHCTRFSHQMMLITEYCSFGNLLNFLRDEWHFLHKLQRRKQSVHTNISYNGLNKENNNTSQELRLPTVDADISEGNNTKQVVINDRTTDNISNDFIQHFQFKYNEINTSATKASAINSNGNSNNNNDAMQMYQTLFQHFDELKAATRISNKESELYHSIHTSGFPTPASSAAADNKSYGYHGFCTNFCKCNVDVIKKNINTETDIEKQNDKLEHVLSEEQQQQLDEQKRQHMFDLNKSLTDTTTIRIKNCECKIKANKYHNGINKFSGVVENKSYFNLFNRNNKHLSPTTQRNVQSNKLKPNNKSQSLTGPKMDFNENHNNNEDHDENVQNDENDIDINIVDVNRVPLTCGDLLYIARQVAVGMEFLAKNKVVHRDLAARNCLVSPDRTIKIADFGLSRDVYQENMYKKSGNGKLPIKWLALESMTHQVYTTQSDVWSFGILLYEIVTLGATPYPSVPINRLLELLKSGYRMEKPKGCSQELYSLMYSCWNAEPIVRPTFNSIILQLDEMLNDLDSPKESSIFYSKVHKHLRPENESIETGSSDESYLKPL